MKNSTVSIGLFICVGWICGCEPMVFQQPLPPPDQNPIALREEVVVYASVNEGETVFVDRSSRKLDVEVNIDNYSDVPLLICDPILSKFPPIYVHKRKIDFLDHIDMKEQKRVDRLSAFPYVAIGTFIDKYELILPAADRPPGKYPVYIPLTLRFDEATIARSSECEITVPVKWIKAENSQLRVFESTQSIKFTVVFTSPDAATEPTDTD